MKIIHYNYALQNKKSGDKYKIDIRTFLDNFTSSSNVKLKNSIKYMGDNLYLFKEDKDFYLFLRTRNDEIIKTIKAGKMEVQDIYSRLSKDERLGFASYIYFSKNFCSFATTQSGPKTTALSELVESLLQIVKLKNYRFLLIPMPTEITQNEAFQFNIIGRTIIELSPEHSFFKELLKTLGIAGHYIEGLEVVIKPKIKRNIKDDFEKLIKKLSNENLTGIKKIMFKAKNDIEESLREFYLIGNNYVYDYINYPKEKPSLEVFENKIKSNAALRSKTENFEEDENYEQNEDLQGLIDNISIDFWNNFDPDIKTSHSKNSK